MNLMLSFNTIKIVLKLKRKVPCVCYYSQYRHPDRSRPTWVKKWELPLLIECSCLVWLLKLVMLTELDAAFNIDEMCDTEHLSPQPGTAWKFEHKPVTSSPVVSFTNITIAETPTLNQPRLKRGKSDFNTKCNFSFIIFKANLSKRALNKHGLFQLALVFSVIGQTKIVNWPGKIASPYPNQGLKLY